MNRKRFSLNAVASSDGARTRISHDRRANTTGRTPYTFCGKEVIISNGFVFDKDTGNCIGKLINLEDGDKYLIGPANKGPLMKN